MPSTAELGRGLEDLRLHRSPLLHPYFQLLQGHRGGQRLSAPSTLQWNRIPSEFLSHRFRIFLPWGCPCAVTTCPFPAPPSLSLQAPVFFPSSWMSLKKKSFTSCSEFWKGASLDVHVQSATLLLPCYALTSLPGDRRLAEARSC